MKKLVLVPFVFILFAILVSCINRQMDERMCSAYSLLNDKPDSAIALLAQCDKKGMERTSRAYYSLIYTIAQDKSGLDVDNDSLLGYAYRYYKHHKDDSLYARCLYYMGKYYYLNDSIKQSTDLLTGAKMAAERQGDLYTQYLALDRLSMAYAKSNPQKSVDAAKQAYSLFCQYDSTNLYNRVFLLIGIGNSYKNYNKLDSTLYYMKLSLLQAKSAQDSALIGESLHALSVGFRNLGISDSALYCAKRACDYVSVIKTSLAMQLAMCYFDCDSIDQAEQIFKQITSLKTNINTRYGAYRYLSEICMNRTSDNEGKQYMDSTLSLLRRIYLNAQKEISDYQTSNEELVQETEQTRVKLKTNLIIGLVALLIFALLVSLLLLSIRNFKRYTKAKALIEKEREKARIEQLELLHNQEIMQKDFEMQAKNNEYQIKIQQLKSEHEKQKLLLKSQEKQLAFAKDYILLKLDVESLQQKVKKEMQNKNLDKSVWIELEMALEEIFSGFSSKFRAGHPNLKEDDFHFCMLVKLGLSNAELEHFYFRGAQTIKQRLLNLKPKLGIESSELSAREYILKYGME